VLSSRLAAGPLRRSDRRWGASGRLRNPAGGFSQFQDVVPGVVPPSLLELTTCLIKIFASSSTCCASTATQTVSSRWAARLRVTPGRVWAGRAGSGGRSCHGLNAMPPAPKNLAGVLGPGPTYSACSLWLPQLNRPGDRAPRDGGVQFGVLPHARATYPNSAALTCFWLNTCPTI
jgi:hypothetical protein